MKFEKTELTVMGKKLKIKRKKTIPKTGLFRRIKVAKIDPFKNMPKRKK